MLYVRDGALLQLDPDDYLASHPLPAGKNIQPDQIGADDETSYHVVQVRDRETLHVHEKSDLRVYVIRGQGSLILGNKTLKLREGSTALIPRGRPHAFINEGSEPAVAWVLFNPPFQAGDNKPVTEAGP